MFLVSDISILHGVIDPVQEVRDAHVDVGVVSSLGRHHPIGHTVTDQWTTGVSLEITHVDHDTEQMNRHISLGMIHAIHQGESIVFFLYSHDLSPAKFHTLRRHLPDQVHLVLKSRTHGCLSILDCHPVSR